MRTQKAERRGGFLSAASPVATGPQSAAGDLEARLAASEKRFEDFAGIVSDWIWETGPNLCFTYLSDRFEQATGLQRDKVLDRTLLDVANADLRDPHWQRHLEDFLARRPVRNFRFSGTLANGDIRHFQVSGNPFFDEAGRFQGYRGTGHDVTESERTHEDLHTVKARLEHLLNTSPAMIYSFKAGGNHAATFASNNIKTQLGHEPHEFLDDPGFWSHHIHPDDADRVFNDLVKLFKTGRHVQEYRFRHKDGTYRWMRDEMVLVEDNDGTPLEAVGYWVDITDRKMAEEAVRESEKALTQTNRALKVVSECNEALVRITDETELLQAVCRIIVESGEHRMAWVGFLQDDEAKTVHPAANWGTVDGYLEEIKVSLDVRAVGQGPIARAIETGMPQVIKDTEQDTNFVSWRDAALKRGYHSVIALPLQIGGRTIGSLAIYSPLSNTFDKEEARLLAGLADNLTYGISALRARAERERAEEAVRRYAEKLERSNRELQDFAYVASHDLQEPLRKIEAFGDRLKVKCADTLGEDGRLYLDRMQNAAARMRALINSLLAYSRVTTKAQPFVPVDLAEVANDAVSDLSVRIERAGAKVDIGPLPTVDADPTQMRQLLLNLIGNGLKFHAEGAAPQVRVTSELCDRDGSGPAPADPNEVWCKISVADNGIGFDEKYVDRIFTMFQRLHGRGEYEGTGIGLATCRKIIERHGGTITAKSAPGQGATFLVHVPVRQHNKE